MTLNQEDFHVVSSVVDALKPFKEVTTEMSAETVTTLSKVVPLVTMLRENLVEQCEVFSGIAKELTETLMPDMLDRRFPNVQTEKSWAGAAYLDPRFKTFVFSDESTVKVIQDMIQKDMRPVAAAEDDDCPVHQDEPATKAAKTSIWDRHDKKIAGHLSKTQTSVRPTVEIRRYGEEAPIHRLEDPLNWWKINEATFPQLKDQAKAYLGCPATSVPSERVFSTTGELISYKRACLSADTVNQIVFLNKNHF